jgi:hypothetical protein
MSDALKAYFAKREKVEVDPKSLRDYPAAMDLAIPKIVNEMKRGEQLAAELRYARSTKSKRKR